jgi:hypothetical protein
VAHVVSLHSHSHCKLQCNQEPPHTKRAVFCVVLVCRAIVGRFEVDQSQTILIVVTDAQRPCSCAVPACQRAFCWAAGRSDASSAHVVVGVVDGTISEYLLWLWL